MLPDRVSNPGPLTYQSGEVYEQSSSEAENKDHQVILLNKFHTSEPSISGEVFSVLFFLFLNTRPPSQRHFGPQGHHLSKFVRGLLGNATY